MAAGDELLVENAPLDSLVQHLVVVNGRPRIVKSQRIMGVSRIAIKFCGGGATSGAIKSVGYVGSYLAEYSAALELSKSQPSQMTDSMKVILNPALECPGDYCQRELRADIVPINDSQKVTVERLKLAV